MLFTMESKTAVHHKLETLITRGRETAGNVVSHVMNNQPSDRLARAAEIEFEFNPESASMNVEYPYPGAAGGKLSQRLHRNALVQMAHTTDLPLRFIDTLQSTAGSWGTELLAHNLNTVLRNRSPKNRYLLRSLGSEVRGFLSDRYRRLDSRPIIEAFATAVQHKDAEQLSLVHCINKRF